MPVTSVERLSLCDSRAFCQAVARRQAGNFYYSFLVLPKPQRRAMCNLYAFFRLTDDLADNTTSTASRQHALDQWRRDLLRTLDLDPGSELAVDAPLLPHQHWPALRETVRDYDIPPALLTAVIDGVEMDLHTTRHRDFVSLYRYCYRVASAVGLSCIRVWGQDDVRADLPAEWAGVALQLTNILRDIAEDLRGGRVYLPVDELARYELTEAELAAGVMDERMRSFLDFQFCRAEDYYARSAVLRQMLPAPGRAVFQVMVDIYHGLLLRMRRQPELVFRQRVSLSRSRKIASLLRAFPTRFFGRSATATTGASSEPW